MEFCPLSMISGNAQICNHDCAYCPPKAIDRIANYSEYWQCLNFPNDMFGNGMAKDGLGYISDSLDNLANAIEGR